MAVTVQKQFESVVIELYQDAFVGSAIENGTTVIQCDLRRHNFQQELGTQATLCWRQESYHVDVHALSTFHHPILGFDHSVGHLRTCAVDCEAQAADRQHPKSPHTGSAVSDQKIAPP